MPPTAIVTAGMSSDGPLSPVSQRMTKAAFFRARSPGVPEKTSPIGDLAGRFDMSTRLRDDDYRAGPIQNAAGGPSAPSANRFMPSHPQNHNINNNNNVNYASSVGTAGHTPDLDRGLARNPTISSDGPLSPQDMQMGAMHIHGAFPATHIGSDGTAYEEDGYEASKESVGMAESSDEMLMSLLAGQAAVDCETMPIAGWEEVESWKKVNLTMGVRNQAERTLLTPCSSGAQLDGEPTIYACVTPSTRGQDPHSGAYAAEAQQQQQAHVKADNGESRAVGEAGRRC